MGTRFELETVLDTWAPDGDPREALVVADAAIERGDDLLLASALDRAYGLDPSDATVAAHRVQVLDRLAVVEHGLLWRWIPAGTFLMGSSDGDPDERPVHPVKTDGFWMTDVPVSWAAYCRLMGWHPPPRGCPRDPSTGGGEIRSFSLLQENKIRLQYCETDTARARDWHAHLPDDRWLAEDRSVGAEEVFGAPDRDGSSRSFTYDQKPMVAVSCQSAEDLASRLSTDDVTVRLPTEAEWEKAARGGLIGKRWSWGDEPPTPARCDFGAFERVSIRPPRSLPPNGYGLYGMCGGVWEWTRDEYDALAYREDAAEYPQEDGPRDRVIRGGSWSDCAEAVRVAFRASLAASRRRAEPWHAHLTPNVGFRLVRISRRTSKDLL